MEERQTLLDRHVLPIVTDALAFGAHYLHLRGWRADWITCIGFTLGLLAAFAIGLGHNLFGFTLILLNRVADGLDGSLARLNGPTDAGAFLDIVCDFMVYGAVVLAFVIAAPETNGLPGAVLLCCYIGTGSSFLAFAILAEKRGISGGEYGGKGFYYLGGLTEGTETIVFMLLASLFPPMFPDLAYGFAALCLLTVIGRVVGGYRQLR